MPKKKQWRDTMASLHIRLDRVVNNRFRRILKTYKISQGELLEELLAFAVAHNFQAFLASKYQKREP